MGTLCMCIAYFSIHLHCLPFPSSFFYGLMHTDFQFSFFFSSGKRWTKANQLSLFWFPKLAGKILSFVVTSLLYDEEERKDDYVTGSPSFRIPRTTWNLMSHSLPPCMLDQSNRVKKRLEVHIMKPKTSYFHCSWYTTWFAWLAAIWTILQRLHFLFKWPSY